MLPEECFEDMSDWEKEHPGTTEFVCEFCGLYTASKSRCNKCEPENPDVVTECLNCHCFFEKGTGSEIHPEFCSDDCHYEYLG